MIRILTTSLTGKADLNIKNMKVTVTRLHLDNRTKSKTISARKRYSSILITQTPVGIQQDYTGNS